MAAVDFHLTQADLQEVEVHKFQVVLIQMDSIQRDNLDMVDKE